MTGRVRFRTVRQVIRADDGHPYRLKERENPLLLNLALHLPIRSRECNRLP